MSPEFKPVIKRLLGRAHDTRAAHRISSDTSAVSSPQTSDDRTLGALQYLIETGHPDQHAFGDMMAGIVQRDADARERGQEREPYRHENVDVLIKTNNGLVIGSKYRDDDFQVAFPKHSFTYDQVLGALAKTFPDAEVHTETPSFLPKGERGAPEGEQVVGLRFPFEEMQEDSGQKVRALWLTVTDSRWGSFESSTLSEDGGFEYYYFPWDSLAVRIEGETYFRPLLKGEKAHWTLHYMYIPQTSLPQVKDMEQKLGTFLGNLLGNGDVIDDSIASISIHPNTFHTPMTPKEAEKYQDHHRITGIRHIEVKSVTDQEVEDRDVTDPYNSGDHNTASVFKVGENEYGILTQRSGGYMMPYLYAQVAFYPEGLPFSQLSEEIERMRTV